MSLQLDSHISYLLHEHDCVILPAFGGFVANYHSAKIDPLINFMHPPKKHIVFNKSLQNNDGLLVNEVASCEGISFKKAQKEVDEFIKNLKDKLHLHKKIVIEGVGTLILSNDNTLLFVQDLTTNHLLTSYGMGTIQSPAIKRVSVQERIEAKIKHIDENHLPRNKKSWLKVAAVLLPLAMLSVLGISKQEKIQTTFANLNPFTSTTTEMVIEIIETTAVDYTLHSPVYQIEEGIQQSFEAKIAAEKIIAQQTPKHFIIAGAFSTERNANNLVRKLKRWNFDNAHIMGQSNSGLYRVCYDGFAKSEDALSALHQIKKTNASAWLLSM
ncbi:MAG: hypothetical protein CMP75_02920 [Flavobacteriales bacterium]|nr:hypothetical protein [Flavobacteriales bacterium]|tara:strand:- start:266 stop:1246 length:981 start_codon:yes stop_codon:yes gene_type:complete